MKKLKTIKLIILVSFLFNLTFINGVSAAILFQDDVFHEIPSEGLIIDSDNTGSDIVFQMGNDGTDGQIVWKDALNLFQFNNTIEVAGGISASGNVNFSGSTQTRLRETAVVTNGVTLCSSNGEVIVQTSTNDIYICTSFVADTWQLVGNTDATTLNGLTSSQFLRSDTSDNYSSGTLTFDAGTVLDVNGAVDFSGAASFIVPTGASNPLTCSVGQLFFNVSNGTLYTCSSSNTWSSMGAQDFESVYAADADNTLTTSNGDFTINAGTGSTTVNANGGIDLNSTGTIGISGGILNFAATAGSFSLSSTSSSFISTIGATSDLTISAGRDIIFNDSKLASSIKLTNVATGFASTLTGGGIIDNINSFTSTAAGEGASNVGVFDDGTNLENIDPLGVVSDVQDALNKIDSRLGAVSGTNEILSFSPEFPDAVINAAATGKGKLESLYDSTEGNIYRWSTQQNSPQNGNLRFRIPIPTDFVTPGTLNLRYRTADPSTANNSVSLTMRDSVGLSCGSSGPVSSTAWANLSFTPSGCSLTPGSVVEFEVNMMDSNNGPSRLAEVGRLLLNYSN